MDIGIIGLENTGKTTIFNALTGLSVEVTSYSLKDSKPNTAVVKLKDQRIDYLNSIFQPEKLKYATMNITDMPAISEEERENWGTKVVEFAKNIDVILEIVRYFNREDVIYRFPEPDPLRDILTLDSEIMFSDYSIIEKRLQRLEKKKGNLVGDEKREFPLLERLKQSLENEIPLRTLSLSEQDLHLLKGYNLLSLKPLLIVINRGEETIDEGTKKQVEDLGEKLNFGVVDMCGELEMEINQLDEAERAEYMEELGVSESAIEIVKKATFNRLGLISFFTVGKDEVKAWPIKKGTTAQKAAGKIHSDIEKGFIKAQVVHFNDFKNNPDFGVLKEKGLLKLEGKDYIVEDGDIIEFRFNV
ncbi:redox-regulated ATPase YchF [candidate division TA06 bacterium]|uniref:Redox-regulated ATPase YchF n=1 Tax=candidate division TA06 bacterium TaxID=2250710 RepID=A0A660SD49_UNCT6|nr:MAG: redox-regulated ATPase YchF [candidate division TA06 bacterium]